MKTRTVLLIAVPVLILLLPFAVWLTDRTVAAGEVPRNVSVAGIPVGGMGADDTLAAIRSYERGLRAEKAHFTLDGTSYELDPTTVGLAVDTDAALDAAMGARDGGFLTFFRSFSEPVDIPVTVLVDEPAVEATLTAWEEDAITDHVFEGHIEVVDGRVVYEHPRNGKLLDLDPARRIVHDVLATPGASEGDLPIVTDHSTLTAEDVDDAVAQVRRLISSAVTLYNPEYDFRLPFVPAVLADAVRIEIEENSPVAIDISLDPRVIAAYVEPRRAPFEIDPVNADFVVDVDTDEVTIIPSLNGTQVDSDLLMEPLLSAAMSETDRVGEFPLIETVRPEFTTEDAEAFGPITLQSEFSTNMPGVNRVHNIQLMADTIDGHVVWPGEEFSINEFVGRRTLAGGYLRDGAIIGGEVTCCDDPANIGGGVSQYGTTFFNALWFGCYEILDHTPHSLYISRYPEGREATLGFPRPDVRFRNDSDAPVIIKHTHTPRQITVKFYGDNGGKVCDAEPGQRFNHTSAPVRYEADPSVPPGSQRVASGGGRGWSITVTRVVTHPDGTVERQPFTHAYRGALRKILVHPCDMPGSGQACPNPIAPAPCSPSRRAEARSQPPAPQ